MSSRVRLEENQVLALLEEMSQVARFAKRISEITEAMDNIAFQTTLQTLDATVVRHGNRDISRMGGTVKDASDDMYSQFNLLLEEVSELNRYIKGKRELQLNGKDFN